MTDNISVFRGIKPEPIKTTTWQTALKTIRSERFRELIEQARAIKDPAEYRKFKTSLPSVTFGGTFKTKRNCKNISYPTGFIISDLDHLGNYTNLIFDFLTQDENVWFVFRSPSGEGIKAGIRAEGIKADVEHKQLFFAIERYFKEVYGLKIDPACKDISRLTFMSHDPGLWINPRPQYFKILDWKPPTHTSQTPKISVSDSGPGKEKYARKVLQSCCKEIKESLPGGQHHVRLKAARLIGGFLQYINEAEVITALEEAVVASGVERTAPAMKTVRDGLAYGKMQPIEIENRGAPRSNGQQKNKLDQALTKSLAEQDVFVDIQDFVLMDLPAIEMILDPWLPTQGLCMIHAKRGTGKTLITCEIAYAVATGLNFLNWTTPRPRGVLYVDGEMSATELQERFVRIIANHGGAGPAKPLTLYAAGLNIHGTPNIGTIEGQSRINKGITDDIELIIIDSLSVLQRDCDENKSVGWEPMQNWLLQLRGLGKAVLLIHHSGKSGDQRGASKREDFMNTVISLKEHAIYSQEEGAKFEIRFEKGRNLYGPKARSIDVEFIGTDWVYRDMKGAIREQIIMALKDEISQKEIAGIFKVSQPYISKIKKEAVFEGLL